VQTRRPRCSGGSALRRGSGFEPATASRPLGVMRLMRVHRLNGVRVGGGAEPCTGTCSYAPARCECKCRGAQTRARNGSRALRGGRSHATLSPVQVKCSQRCRGSRRRSRAPLAPRRDWALLQAGTHHVGRDPPVQILAWAAPPSVEANALAPFRTESKRLQLVVLSLANGSGSNLTTVEVPSARHAAMAPL
jgi:hypothetical protein